MDVKDETRGYFWSMYNDEHEVTWDKAEGYQESLGECLIARLLNNEVVSWKINDNQSRVRKIMDIIDELKELGL